MNLHVLADRLTALLGGLFAGKDRFFARALDDTPLVDVITATRVEAPDPDGPGIYEATAETPAGVLTGCYPLLAEHDQFVRYAPQAASYGDIPVATIGRGHVTAAGSPALLRDHLRQHFPEPRPAR